MACTKLQSGQTALFFGGEQIERRRAGSGDVNHFVHWILFQRRNDRLLYGRAPRPLNVWS